MDGERIVAQARELKTAFGAKCRKFVGAATVEILRKALVDEGIPVSARDVFVRAIPVEADLAIPKDGQEPYLGLLYEATQLAAVLEVKNSGCVGERSIEKVRRDLGRFRDADISCAYVTFEERAGYTWAASSDSLGFPCFTLAWYRRAGGPIEPTNDWAALIAFLRKCTGSHEGAIVR
jgi:hypothetical protein